MQKAEGHEEREPVETARAARVELLRKFGTTTETGAELIMLEAE